MKTTANQNIAYVLYKATIECRKAKEYYPLCTTSGYDINQTEVERYDSLEAALADLNSTNRFYFPCINSYGCYEECFVQVELNDEDGEFDQVLETYAWNQDCRFVWRETAHGIEVYDYDAVEAMMDDEIREEIHNKYLFNDNQKFFLKYCEMHEEKFGEEFEIG